MSLDVSYLRNIQSTHGALKSQTADATKPAVIGNSALGKLATWFQDPGKTANKALKQDFVETLSKTYGKDFGNQVEARVTAGSKPLSLKLVKELINEGDKLLQNKAAEGLKAHQRLTDQNKSATNVLANAFSSHENVGDRPSPLKTALRQPAEEFGFDMMLNKLNREVGNSGDREVSGFSYSLSQVKVPDSVRAEIKSKIIEAGQNGAHAVSVEEAVSITKDVISKSGLFERKTDFLVELDKMQGLTSGQKAAAADAIVRNDYPSFEAFKSSYFRTAPTGEMSTSVYGGKVSSQVSHSNASLSQVVDGLKNKPYDSQTYNPASFFEKISNTGVAKDWSINRSIQAHFAEGLPEKSETRLALDQRSLVFMAKCALSPKMPHEAATSTAPWQAGSAGKYFRGGTELTDMYSQTLAKSIGVGAGNIQLVTDSRVMEVVKRDFAATDGGNVLSWNEGDLDKLMESAKSGDSKIFLDVTAFMDGTTHAHRNDPDNLKEAVDVGNSFLHDVVMGHVDDYVARHAGDIPPPNADALKQALSNRIILGSTMQIGDQTVLYTRGLGFRDASDKYTADSIKNIMEAPPAFRAIANHNGFALGPNQLIESWLKTAPNTETVADNIGYMMSGKVSKPQDVAFPTDISGLATFATMAEFRDTDIYKAFEALAQNTAGTAAPYQTILGRATLGMMKGLESVEVHQAFKEAGLEGLLQISLNRMQAAMQNAVAAGSDQRAFMGEISNIHEEIATLLAVVKPMTGPKFNEMMNKVQPLLPKGFSEDVTAFFQMKNSGMRSLSSALSGIETLKESLGKGSALNIAYQADSYYESSMYVLSGNVQNKSFKLDGRKLDNSSNEILTSFSEAEKSGAAPQKLDLYIAEFHHNISYDLNDYVAEPVKDQVDKLFAAGLASDKFTVALDVTISRTDAPEIQEFLAHNKDRIENGQLNVVFYRSGQKFDMGGMDNFNGGIMATVNNGDKGGWGKFNATARGETTAATDKISDFNLQGLGAYQAFAHDELNDYRSGIMANTAKLNNLESTTNPLGMPKEMFASEGNIGKAFLQLAENRDPGAVFLDFRASWMERGSPSTEAFYGGLQKFLSEHLVAKHPDKFMIEARPSFGFPHSNVSIIGGSKFRFNPGLESDAVLKNYKEAFIAMNQIFGQVMKDYRDPETFNAIAYKLLSDKQGLAVMDILMSEPDITKLDSKTRLTLGANLAAIGNFKAAARAVEGIVVKPSEMNMEERLQLGRAFAHLGDLTKARNLIGRIGNVDVQLASLLNDAEKAIVQLSADKAPLRQQMQDAAKGLKVALQSGETNRITIMSALGKVHDLAIAQGLDPEATMRNLLSDDLKSRSPAQLANIVHNLNEALKGLDDREDPIQNAMRSVRTFADQDMALALNFATNMERMAGLRPRDPSSDPKKTYPQHVLGDFSSSVNYYLVEPQNRKPLGGGDKVVTPESDPALYKLTTTVAGFALSDISALMRLSGNESVKTAVSKYLGKLSTDEGLTRKFDGLSDMMTLVENGVRRQIYNQFDGMVKNAHERDRDGFSKEASDFENSVNSSAHNLDVLGTMFTDPSFLRSIDANLRDDMRRFGEHYLAVAAELSDPKGAAQSFVEYAKLVRTDPDYYMQRLVPVAKGMG